MDKYSVSIVTGISQADPYVFQDLLVKAVNDSVFKGTIPINIDKLKHTSLVYTEGQIDLRCLILLTYGEKHVGFLIGELTTMERYNQDVLIASETLWWIDPEHRGCGKAVEMIELFEDWAKYTGAQFITMTAQTNEYLEKIGRLYNKLGYTKLEETYLKKVEI